MGGDWVPDDDNPSLPGPGTDMVGPEERLAHVEKLQPEICSLDCGTMNFGEREIYISTPDFLRKMASQVQSWGVKPELEVFDLGQIQFAKSMIDIGLIDDPPLFQICLGIPWGAPADTKACWQCASSQCQLSGVWDLSNADAHDGTSGAAGRERSRRARGQFVLKQGATCIKCRPCSACGRGH